LVEENRLLKEEISQFQSDLHEKEIEIEKILLENR